jgi:hypothetical protein
MAVYAALKRFDALMSLEDFLTWIRVSVEMLMQERIENRRGSFNMGTMQSQSEKSDEDREAEDSLFSLNEDYVFRGMPGIGDPGIDRPENMDGFYVVYVGGDFKNGVYAISDKRYKSLVEFKTLFPYALAVCCLPNFGVIK